MDWDVVVVGAGAAGLVAAERAASRGLRTLLLEKNRRPGVKILMSGGTRCNLTHNTDARGIVAAYGKQQGSFLHSALATLNPLQLVALVEDEGVATKIEETGKIFPASDRAVDVLAAFVSRLQRSGCTTGYSEPLSSIRPQADGFELQTPERTLTTRNLIITVGGKSYPGCGTCGEGYDWGAQLGHTIVPLRPALTPITTESPWIRQLQGVTLPDAALAVYETPTASALPVPDNVQKKPKKQRPLDARRGSLLFTHFGLSGPTALDISRVVSGHARPQSLELELDFWPDIAEPALFEQLQQIIRRDGKKQASSLLGDPLPRRLVEVLLEQTGIDPLCKLAELGKISLAALVAAIKRSRVRASGTRGYMKAEVTAGGISLAQVDSKTLQSKIVPRLYWAGEVLDLDGPIGGFNFQAAFSTGWLAGLSVE